MQTYITATGLYIPPHSISNAELVNAFNQYVDNYNEEHKDAIANEEVEALTHSSVEFIEKVSGIKSRYVMNKSGILDPKIMAPVLPARKFGEEPSLMAEMGVGALQQALDNAGLEGSQLDGIIVACSNSQRAYPAISIEIQDLIGMKGGFAYDMNVACSAATFGIAQAVGCIKSGMAKKIAMLNIEICSAHLNWRNRDSHFIFGDVATATIIECDNPRGHRIVDCDLLTEFSVNIKNESGFLDRCEALAVNTTEHEATFVDGPINDKLFLQNGRKVFREVCPKVSKMIIAHAEKNDIQTTEIKRMWLHQANINMIDLIRRTVVGKNADSSVTPTVIDEFANTSSASPMIAFHRYENDLKSGEYGVICSFGAGYSIGSVIVEKA